VASHILPISRALQAIASALHFMENLELVGIRSRRLVTGRLLVNNLACRHNGKITFQQLLPPTPQPRRSPAKQSLQKVLKGKRRKCLVFVAAILPESSDEQPQ
jgi:hypothetical protein